MLRLLFIDELKLALSTSDAALGELLGFLAELLDLVVALISPLKDEMASEDVGVLERSKGPLGIATRRKVEEGETARLVVELARKADRVELTVSAEIDMLM